MPVVEGATPAAVELIPAFDGVEAVDDRVTVNQGPVTDRTQQVRRRRVGRRRGTRESFGGIEGRILGGTNLSKQWSVGLGQAADRAKGTDYRLRRTGFAAAMVR